MEQSRGEYVLFEDLPLEDLTDLAKSGFLHTFDYQDHPLKQSKEMEAITTLEERMYTPHEQDLNIEQEPGDVIIAELTTLLLPTHFYMIVK